jgi:hypothetical protein
LINARMSFLRRAPFEAMIWVGGMVALFFFDPASSAKLDLCLFHWLGLGPCPGCGLGAAIHHFLHGDVAASWEAHPLGIPALSILAARVIGLLARPQAAGSWSLRTKGAREWQT